MLPERDTCVAAFPALATQSATQGGENEGAELSLPPLPLQGQRAAWAKLSAIQANCAIEVTMDECLKQVRVTHC